MKGICITFLILSIIALSVIGFYTEEQTANVEYLRIHIRADSNNQEDQAIKYSVKDEIVDYLAPKIAVCKSYEDAENMLKESLSDIEKVCDRVLEEKGFDYKSKASIKIEEFPTRAYQNVILDAGIYRALIINLGSGKGDNWWCVAYPPLCFTQGNYPYEYKSLIIDAIRKFNEMKLKKEK